MFGSWYKILSLQVPKICFIHLLVRHIKREISTNIQVQNQILIQIRMWT